MMTVTVFIQPYINVSAATLLFFDYFVTLQREVEFVWPSERNFMKILFFISRYSPFLDVPLDVYFEVAPHAITGQTWRVVYLVTRWLFFFGVIWAEIVLLVRTWALWGKKQSIMIVLVVAYTLAIGSSLVFTVIWTESLVAVPAGPDNIGFPGDVVLKGNPIVGLCFAVVVLVETCVIALTGVRMVRQLRSIGSGFLKFSAVRVLYRDGFIFFFYLFAISTGNFVVIITGKGNHEFLLVMQRVLHSCLATRILLNIREAHQHGNTSGMHIVDSSTC